MELMNYEQTWALHLMCSGGRGADWTGEGGDGRVAVLTYRLMNEHVR